MEKDKQIIKQITKIRARNNIAWMRILQIAFDYAPDQARLIFKDICHNDAEINKLSKELAND